MSEIRRFHDKSSQPVVFTDSTSTSGGFVMSSCSGALLLVDSVVNGPTVTLNFHARASSDSPTAYTVASATNTAIAVVVQSGRCYALPDALFAAGYVQATTGTAGQTVSCFVQMKG